MSQPADSIVAQVRKPMIAEDEVDALAQRYGAPVRRTHAMIADEYIRYYRFRPDNDRRAEVVFAIQNPAGQIWLHTKANYPSNIFRLMSGGIQWDETVEGALWREVEEENKKMILDAGFSHCETIFKWVNFATFIAIKK